MRQKNRAQSVKNKKLTNEKLNYAIDNQRIDANVCFANNRKSELYKLFNTLPAMKKRYKLITALPAFLLLFFTTSCSQPADTQAEERSGLMEQIEEIRTLPIAPDSIQLLFSALWVENAHRMTENEKSVFYNARGITYARTQEFEAAEINLLKALYYLEKLNNGNLGRQVLIMKNLGTMHLQQGLLDEALDTYRQALALIENNHNETDMMLRLYLNKITILMHRGETDSALNYIRLVLDIAVQEGFREWEALALKHIASSFIHLEKFAQAEENLRRAIPVFIEYSNQRMLWLAYHHLASILLQQNKLEEGLLYAQKSDEIAAAAGLPSIGMTVYYERRGQIYMEKGRYADSLAVYYKSLELRRKMQDAGVMGEMKNVIGKIYRRMGNFDTAYSHLDIARGIAQENSLLRLEADVQGNLAVIYAARGDMDNFLTAIETERRLRQKISNEQNTRALHEMQVRYETEIKRLLIVRQAEEIQHTNRINILLSVVLTLAVVLFVLAFIFHRRKVQEANINVRHYEELLKHKKETQTQEQEEEQSASKKLALALQHLFETEKIYRRQGLSVDDVTQTLKTNSKYLSNAIKEHFQKGFVEYVNTYRVEEAIEMLKKQEKNGKNAHYSVEMIAEAVGFSNRTTFYITFKRIVGVTPKEYMEVLKEQEKTIEKKM